MQALVDITRDFSKQFPEVYFDVTYIPPSELRTIYENEASQGRGPTLLLGPVAWGPSLWEAGVVQDLADLIDPGILEEINPASLESSYTQNQLVSIPYSIHGVVLFRNKEIMTITADTFEEMVMISQAAAQGDTQGAMLERGFFFSGAHLFGLGGTLMDENGFPGFNSQAGEAWLKLLRNFELAGPPTYLSNQDLEEFKAGTVGWIIDGSWNLVSIAEAVGVDHLAVDPWPEYDGGQLSGFVQSDNLYLNTSAQADHLRAALSFIEFFIDPRAQAHLAAVNLIPARLFVDLPESPYSLLVSQSMIALAEGTPFPNSPYMDFFNLQMDLAIKKYLDAGLPPAQILQEAEDSVIEEINRTGETPTPAPQ